MSSVSGLNSLLSSSTSSTSSSSSSIDLSSLLSAATGATSTGIDVTSAVAAAIYAAQAPERQWQAQQTTIKSQITALTSVQTALSSLSTDLQNLGNLSGPLTSRSVTSSSSVVTATATNGAAIGSHTVSVGNLAAASSWYSPAVSSVSASLGNMQLQITGANGTTHTISTSGSTLTQLAASINSSGAGVTASVVTDATGARLALVGSTGAANDFSVSFSAVTGSTWSSTSVTSASAPLTAGSFQVGDGTNTATISISSGDTLASVASQINAAGLNVTASITTDSNGAHLDLAATNTATLSTVGDPAFSPTRASQAVNASLTVDGVPLSSATNTVTGAASGLTLNLSGTTSGFPTTLSVSANQSQITSAVSAFVSDYNTALSQVNTQFTYDSTSGSQGVLSGDATLRSLQSTLMNAVGYSAPASSSGAAVPNTTLASLGITMNDDGSLSLDSGALSQAVSSNNTAIQNFFQGNALNGFAQTLTNSLKTFTSPSNGALTASMKNLNSTYTSLQSQVDDYESGYIASQKTVLTAMYSKAEIALQSLPATLKQLQAQLGGNSGS